MEKEDSFEKIYDLISKVTDSLGEEDVTVAEYGQILSMLWVDYCISMDFENDELADILGKVGKIITMGRDKMREENKNGNHNTRRGRWEFCSERT